jgi:VIT1/CCC1 family predicted Fe2+/Mn2+ transporter
MGAVGYTSSVARGELFRAERAREYRHVEATPAIEREEIRRLYAKKGFREPLLGRVVDTICESKDVWVAVMMAEEHELADVDRSTSLRSAAIVGAASLAGAVIPILPFSITSRWVATGIALVVSAAALFALGAFKARVTATRKARGGAVLAAIGLLSALAGYIVGSIFGVAP